MTEPQRSAGFGRLLRRLFAVVVVVALGGGVVWGFIEGSKERALEAEREKPIKAPQRISIENDKQVITLDSDAQQRNGIVATAIEPAPYQERVRGYGTVVDLARLTDLSNNYQNARAQLQTAKAKLEASRPAFERAQALYKNGQVVSQATLQAAEATFRTDEAAVASAESQIGTLTATVQQEWGPAIGKALVERSPLITRLIGRQDFLLQITLPPGVSLAAPPQTADVQTAAGSQAEIKFVSPATRTDPKIQGLSFFYLAAADSGILPGMNVLAFLPSGHPVDGTAIPSSAVIWWQDRAWVYRRSAPDKFARHEIMTDLPAPGGGYIVKNIPMDTFIVTSGAQMLLSEEFRAQIQVGEDKK
jgi:exonuclease VII small subunit